MAPSFMLHNAKKEQILPSKMSAEQCAELPLVDFLDPKSYEKLTKIRNREHLLSEAQSKRTVLAVAEAVLAFLHDYRANDFELNCESGWTISKLSATLSCFVEFSESREMLISFLRRCLVVPYFKSFALGLRVIQDFREAWKFGRKLLLKVLLEILRVFDLSAPRYLLNRLYVEDWIVFVQKVDEKLLEGVMKELFAIQISMEDLGLPPLVESDSEDAEEVEADPTDFGQPSSDPLNELD